MRFKFKSRLYRMTAVTLYMTFLIPIYIGVFSWVLFWNVTKLVFYVIWSVVWDFVSRTKELIEVNDHD